MSRFHRETLRLDPAPQFHAVHSVYGVIVGLIMEVSHIHQYVFPNRIISQPGHLVGARDVRLRRTPRGESPSMVFQGDVCAEFSFPGRPNSRSIPGGVILLS